MGVKQCPRNRGRPRACPYVNAIQMPVVNHKFHIAFDCMQIVDTVSTVETPSTPNSREDAHARE